MGEKGITLRNCRNCSRLCPGLSKTFCREEGRPSLRRARATVTEETCLSRLGAAAPPVHTSAERYLGKYEYRAAPVPSSSRRNGRESGKPISWLESGDQERCTLRHGEPPSGRHHHYEGALSYRSLRVTPNRNERLQVPGN